MVHDYQVDPLVLGHQLGQVNLLDLLILMDLLDRVFPVVLPNLLDLLILMDQ